MRKLLIVLIIPLLTGCVSTDNVRDFTQGAAQGVIKQSDPYYYQEQQVKRQQQEYLLKR